MNTKRRLSLARRLSELGNHDFCPWANRYVYWLKQPIGWFVVGATASLLIALFVTPHAWITFGSLIAVMIMGVLWPWAAVRGVYAELSFKRPRCHEGELVAVRLSIHNRWPVPLWGMAVEKGFFSGAMESGESPVVALASVPGWSRSEFVFEFRPPSRGVYPHEAPELVTGFPFGLWRAHCPIAIPRDLLVWPETTPLASIPALDGEIADVIGMLFDRPGSEGDMIGTRPYRQGDRLRSIHWAQTARRDAFIVTERQAAARRLVVVMCDAEAFQSDDTSARLETAIRVAASLTREFHAHHAQVRFMLGDLDMILEPGPTGLRQLLDALARYRGGRATPTGHDTSDALMAVVTSSARQPTHLTQAMRGRVRFVLIDEAREVSSLRRRGKTWIKIDSGENYSQQLRRQWERVCHDSTAS